MFIFLSRKLIKYTFTHTVSRQLSRLSHTCSHVNSRCLYVIRYTYLHVIIIHEKDLNAYDTEARRHWQHTQGERRRRDLRAPPAVARVPQFTKCLPADEWGSSTL